MTQSLALSTYSSSATDLKADGITTNPWILNPVADTLFGFGGIVWLFFGFHYFVLNGTLQGSYAEALLLISASGALIFAETHTITTILTVYKNKDSRSKFSLYTKWLALVCIVLAVGGTFISGSASVLIKIYLLMVPHHFMSQSYGIALLYCMKRGYKISKWDKLILLIFVQSTAWYAVIRELTYRDWSGETFLLTKVPFWGPLPPLFCSLSEVILYASCASLIILIIYNALKHDKIFPIPAQLTLLTGATAFTLGPYATGIYWLYVSAFFHGTQYLMIVTAKHIKESNKDKTIPAKEMTSHFLKGPALQFLGLALLVSLSIYILLPKLPHLLNFHFVGIKQFEFAAIIFATMNFFHIITDGAIWKLKDQKTRASLVD